jgi:hypothetical protein
MLELSYICTVLVYADDLLSSQFQVVKWMCGAHTSPVRGCLDKPVGMNYEDLPSQCGSHARELASGLRLGTAVPSQDLSGA